MRILIVTNHFFPETFRVNDAAFGLAERGHDVTVLTAIPDYPLGHYFDGYGLFRKRVERVNGVKVLRAAIIPRGKGGALRLVLNYASALVSQVFWSLGLSFGKRFDAVFIHDTSPATVCIPPMIIRALRGTPIVHWIFDIWPESLVAGGIRSHRIYSAVGRMMKWIYRSNDYIQISSKGFRKLLVERGVPDSKIGWLPNWSDDTIAAAPQSAVPEGTADSQSAAALGNSASTPDLVSIPATASVTAELTEGFIIMFAGNLGEAQNLENVMQAAMLTKGSSVRWVFLGDGRKKAWMEKFIADNGLSDNVFLMGRRPMEQMPSWFAAADVMLVSLCGGASFDFTLPAKVQAYMSCAKPILTIAGDEVKDTITAAGCGWCVDADDPEGLARQALDLSSLPSSELSARGQNGLRYYTENFEKSICMDKIQTALDSVAKSSMTA